MNMEKINKFLCSETEKGERENKKTWTKKGKNWAKVWKKNERSNKGRARKQGIETEGKARNQYEIVGHHYMQSEKTVEFIHQKWKQRLSFLLSSQRFSV